MIRRAPLLVAVAAVLLTAAMWFLLVAPQREEQARLRDEIAAIVARQNAQRLQIARLEEIKANELDVRADIARMEQYIPDGAAQPSAIRQLQLVADASGVEISSVTFSEPVAVAGAPAPPVSGTVLASVPVSMVVEGGYFQVADFLRRMEVEIPRAVLVDSITITEAQQPARFPTLSVTMMTRMFTVVPAVAVAPAPGSPPGPPPASPQPASPPPAGAPEGRVTPVPAAGGSA
jgi:Tfp pilus assembly protein PilO